MATGRHVGMASRKSHRGRRKQQLLNQKETSLLMDDENLGFVNRKDKKFEYCEQKRQHFECNIFKVVLFEPCFFFTQVRLTGQSFFIVDLQRFQNGIFYGIKLLF